MENDLQKQFKNSGWFFNKNKICKNCGKSFDKHRVVTGNNVPRYYCYTTPKENILPPPPMVKQ